MKLMSVFPLFLVLFSTFAQASTPSWTCSFTEECVQVRGSGYQVLGSFTATGTHQYQGTATVNAMRIAVEQCQADCNLSTAWCTHWMDSTSCASN